MTQKAVVKRRLDEARVEIEVRRDSACGHSCAQCGGCAGGAGQAITAIAEDPLRARVGQTVTVESATGRVLGLAVILYLLPFAVLLTAAALLHNRPEGIAALGSVAAFLVSLFGVCLPLDRYLRRKKAVTFRVVALGS